MIEGHRRQIAVGHLLNFRIVTGFDAPDQAADDPRRGDFGLQAAGLPIVLALDRVEREPATDGARPWAPTNGAPDRTMPAIV